MKLFYASLLLFFGFTLALRPGGTTYIQHLRSQRLKDPKVPGLKNTTFTQYIDHDNPERGTFEQFYYYDDTYWAGPGSPVVFTTPGEEAVKGTQFLAFESVIPGALAKAIGGAIVIMEHRFYGESSPVRELTTANLKFLNVKQVIADFTHFANNANLPFDPHGTSRAGKAPWVFSGCSYAGALSGWIAATSPGTFWAYQASSAVVEAIYSFWEYFVPIEQGTPENCLKDIRLVVEHVTRVLTHGSPKEKTDLKAMFMLEHLEHDTDFASTLISPIFNSQYLPIDGYDSFCNYVENVPNPRKNYPHYKGVGLEKALKGYAEYFKKFSLKGYCQRTGIREFQGEYNVKCFDSYNKTSPFYTDIRVDNPFNRQFFWLLCNEPIGYWADHPPDGRPSIVSKLVTAGYQQRMCGLFFPTGPDGQTYGSKKGKTEGEFNKYTKGWNFENSTRLLWGNSEFDPYREATVSANFRPGGPLKSTAKHPVFIAEKQYHCGDYQNLGNNRKVFEAEVEQIKKWVEEYPRSTHEGT